jgi:tripartite-type tricarboxylate transporter receptor subunit TctC
MSAVAQRLISFSIIRPGHHRSETPAELHALAVTSATRSEALPDIPTMGDFVPEYEAGNFRGVGAPKNTQPPPSQRQPQHRCLRGSASAKEVGRGDPEANIKPE